MQMAAPAERGSGTFPNKENSVPPAKIKDADANALMLLAVPMPSVICKRKHI